MAYILIKGARIYKKESISLLIYTTKLNW